MKISEELISIYDDLATNENSVEVKIDRHGAIEVYFGRHSSSEETPDAPILDRVRKVLPFVFREIWGTEAPENFPNKKASIAFVILDPDFESVFTSYEGDDFYHEEMLSIEDLLCGDVEIPEP